MTIKARIALLIRRAVRFIARDCYEQSPWMRGLLDAEADRLVEPYDWDCPSDPGYWAEYCAGVAAYRHHKKASMATITIRDAQAQGGAQ